MSRSSATSLHSRVARSNLALLAPAARTCTLIGPPTLIPREIETAGVSVSHEIGDIAAADVVYVLRMQRERMLPGRGLRAEPARVHVR